MPWIKENGDLDGVKSAIGLGAPVNATNESLWIQAGEGTKEALRK